MNKQTRAYRKLYNFLVGTQGKRMFRAYLEAGAPYGKNGVGWWRWIQEQVASC